MTLHSTKISVMHGDGAVVTVRPTDDGRWFRVLNWIIDAGHWANLPDPQRNVLIVLARHRREDGLSAAGIDALCAGSGLARPTAYRALAGLLAHTPRILCKHGPELWELFPGRAFAGRRSPGRDSSLSPETPVSGQRLPALSPSHSPSALRPENKTTTTNDRVSPCAVAGARETDRVVALLEVEGFDAADARRLVSSSTPAQVRKAIANANELDAGGRLKNRRGYIARAIRDGWSLFGKVEARAVKALAAKLQPLHQAGTWPLDADTTERINRRWGGGQGIVRAGIVSPEEIEAMDAMELVGVIAARAES